MKRNIMDEFDWIKEDGVCDDCKQTVYTTPLSQADPYADWGHWCDVCEWHSEGVSSRIRKPEEFTLDMIIDLKRTLDSVMTTIARNDRYDETYEELAKLKFRTLIIENEDEI